MIEALTIKTLRINLSRTARDRKTGIPNFSIARCRVFVLYEVLPVIDAVFTGLLATACHTLRIQLESAPW
jgi:hypothetical protein